nr:acyl--CoA ligase [Candidatus Desulfolinea nitratireducens]
MSFLNAFTENVHKYPDKVALEFIEPPLQSFTYAELDQLIQRTMLYLQGLGVEPGDRVALQLSKSLEFILLHLATVRLGAITLPLNLAYPPEELKYFLSDSGAKLFFALESSKENTKNILSELPDLQDCIFLNPSEPEQFISLIPESLNPTPDSQLPEIDFQDTAIIIYTSGTTGRPKGAEITHGNIQSNLEALHTAWGWRPDDVLLHILPIFHVHGLFVALHGALHAGATTLMMRAFNDRKTLQNLVERKCTVLMAVPTIHRRLISIPNPKDFDLSHVRLITSGSDRLPDE